MWTVSIREVRAWHCSASTPEFSWGRVPWKAQVVICCSLWRQKNGGNLAGSWQPSPLRSQPVRDFELTWWKQVLKLIRLEKNTFWVSRLQMWRFVLPLVVIMSIVQIQWNNLSDWCTFFDNPPEKLKQHYSNPVSDSPSHVFFPLWRVSTLSFNHTVAHLQSLR